VTHGVAEGTGGVAERITDITAANDQFAEVNDRFAEVTDGSAAVNDGFAERDKHSPGGTAAFAHGTPSSRKSETTSPGIGTRSRRSKSSRPRSQSPSQK
jgi:hypothetical protein